MKYGQTTHFLLNIDAEVSEPTNASNPLSDTAKLRGEYSETGELVYDIPEKAAKVTVKRRKCDHAEAVVQQVTVKNEGAEAFVLDSLSSLFVSGIGEDGGRKWYDHRFIIHYCHSVWQGEGQWRSMDIVDAGLYPTYNHGHQSLIRLSDIGSMSTRRFYPMLMLEDRELGEIWYFELEASSSWYIEVSVRGCQDNSSLCVFLSTAHEKNDGWYQILKPHEEYTSSAAAYGCVKGGFEAAVRELTAYKRERSLVTWRNGVVPVCFNDYMNCLWALPTSEKLIPLIDKAAEAGCEVFCIDDGWYRFPEGNLRDMGTWLHNDALFGEYGFCGIIEYIKNKGMRPGIWLELESAMIDCEAARNIPDALLMRHGKPVGKQRCFLNFRSRGVREYVLEVIDRLYGMGVRYIKNDYNQSAGVGVDSDEFPLRGLLQRIQRHFLILSMKCA